MKIGEIFKDKLKSKLKTGEAKIRTLEANYNKQKFQTRKKFPGKIGLLYKKQNDMQRLLREIDKIQ